MSSSGIATRMIDNERVQVTRWTFAPLAATGWHRHDFDYVIVPLLDGTLKIVEGGEEKLVALTKGVPYFRSAGVEHDVSNANAYDYEFIEIEIK
jgi:quercetin dioxygenase-like cupin family protein